MRDVLTAQGKTLNSIRGELRALNAQQGQRDTFVAQVAAVQKQAPPEAVRIKIAHDAMSEMRKVLVALEWAGKGQSRAPVCPMCAGYKSKGHARGCHLAEVIGPRRLSDSE